MTRLPAVPAALVVAAGAVVLLACGSGETQGPELADYTGTYEGSWTVRMEALDVSGRREAECPGRVEVTSQSDSSFGGTVHVDPGGESSGGLSCRDVEGRIVESGLGTGGLSSFHVRSGDRSGAEAITGCDGQGLWQGDFRTSPSLPEEATFEAGLRINVSCESGDGRRSYRTQINFTGHRE